MMRVTVYTGEEQNSVFLAPSAVYMVTPCTESASKAVGMPTEGMPSVPINVTARMVRSYLRALPEEVRAVLREELPANGASADDWLALLVEAGKVIVLTDEGETADE